MNTKAPDISDIKLEELQEHTFPSSKEFRITISDQAYEFMYKHAKANTEIEVCGVLIGEIYKDKQGAFLEITNAIRGEHAINQGVEVTFTHETWAYIHEEKDSKYPDKRIVGWYHTHPRFGIFLSPQDMFIHENFFNQPWQVAFVIDPISEDEGFFVWHNGKATRIEQYWVGGSKKALVGDLAGPRAKKTDDLNEGTGAVIKQNEPRPQSTRMFIALMILSAFLLVYLIRMDFGFRNLLFSHERNLLNFFQKPTQTHAEKNYVEIIKSALSQDSELAGLDIKIRQENNYILCSGEAYTWYQKERIEKVVGSIEGVALVDLQGIVVTHQYMTNPGDNLSTIAAKVYGDPAKWPDIVKANQQQLTDPNMLKPSTRLIIPENFK